MIKLNLRDRIQALRDLYTNLQYSRLWDHLANLHAKHAILATTDQEAFESAAKRDVDWLLTVLPRDAVILDVGCGIGRIEKYLSPHCKEIHSCDVSRVMLSQAGERLAGLQNVHLHLVNGSDLDCFRDEQFDGLFSLLVLQHLEQEDAYRYLLEFNRVLKPAGICVTQFPNMRDESYFGDFETFSAHRRIQRSIGRTRIYTEEEVRIKLKHAGFEILQLDATSSDISVVTRKVNAVAPLSRRQDNEDEKRRAFQASHRRHS